jgi:hypothetical protein
MSNDKRSRGKARPVKVQREAGVARLQEVVAGAEEDREREDEETGETMRKPHKGQILVQNERCWDHLAPGARVRPSPATLRHMQAGWDTDSDEAEVGGRIQAGMDRSLDSARW